MVNISQPEPKIPPLQIGDGKEEPKLSVKTWFKSLTDWFIGITIRW